MSPHGKLVLTAAQPVEIFGVVRGAVSLMREGKAVEEAVRAIKVTVLRAFFFALLVTVLLTIYLSEAIVYPIVRLAHATERVRQNLLHKDSIPDLSWRGDEIGDLSRAFREMTAALDARIDSISGFAADVAHEIKNPLASVKSAIEAFAVVKDEAQRQKLLSVIHDDVNRMSRLITDISNASRLDSELSRAERHPVDLAVLVKEAVAAEGARLGDPSKILLYAEDGLRLPVSINDTQMGQVIHNLIDNALSFVTEKGKVVVSTGIREGKIYMNVDNAGSPIPEDKLEAVFERFYSERPKTEKFGMHSGLGLSICRQIVRMHRGEITAQNLKDKAGVPQGVRFTVLLPAAAGVK
jgi:two-component system sensor histidine kinase ChvG